MAGTLLIGSPETSWLQWLEENRRDRDHLVLDPSDPSFGFPARVILRRGTRPVAWRFYGSIDAQRAPHVLIAALAQLLPLCKGDPVVQLFPYRATPLMRQVTMLAAALVQPDEIFVASIEDLDLNGFPVGPQPLDLDRAFLPMVQDAQRRAQWLKLVEQCEEHTVDLRKVALEGVRLGSGTALDQRERTKLGLENSLHVERTGGSLLIVSEEDPDESVIGHVQDMTGTHRTVLVTPKAYEGLLCAFTRGSGEDFGMGLIESIDWESFRARVLCTAVAPAPVQLLRLGSLRINTSGRELGEARPWQL